jgi:hypothetical protein
MLLLDFLANGRVAEHGTATAVAAVWISCQLERMTPMKNEKRHREEK